MDDDIDFDDEDSTPLAEPETCDLCGDVIAAFTYSDGEKSLCEACYRSTRPNRGAQVEPPSNPSEKP
jgi:hypothetical protein